MINSQEATNILMYYGFSIVKKYNMSIFIALFFMYIFLKLRMDTHKNS